MCIIAIKNKNQKMISEEILQRCWDTNSHGGGYMYFDEEIKKVIILKGFMTFKGFMGSIKENYKKLENSNSVFHFRISTSGGINQELTHPYPLNGNLKALELQTDVGMAHNGMINIDVENGYNDTQTYIKKNLINKYQKDKYFYQDKKEKDIIKSEIGYSRIVFLNENGFHLVGNWITDDYIYSNSDYKDLDYDYYYHKYYETGTQNDKKYTHKQALKIIRKAEALNNFNLDCYIDLENIIKQFNNNKKIINRAERAILKIYRI